MKLADLYTTEQVAERYHVKLSTVWRWIRDGRLDAIKPDGKRYLISDKMMRDFEEKNNDGKA